MAWYNPVDWAQSAYDKVSGAYGDFKQALANDEYASSPQGQFQARLDAAQPYAVPDPNGLLSREAGQAGRFADTGEQGFASRGADWNKTMDFLGQQMRGENSLAAEQLRQGLQQGMSQQQAMAAGARPGNQLAASRQAMMNAGQMASGLSGQQALAGIQERNAAANALGNMQGQARQQELQAALQGRQNALAGYGKIEDARTSRYGATVGAPYPGDITSKQDRFLGLIGSGLGALGMMSDKRLKKDIETVEDPEEFLEALKAYKYRYKAERHGKGDQFGIMAQDLEKSKTGKATVVDTAEGKMVDTRKLATALAAASSSMHKRIKKLEGR